MPIDSVEKRKSVPGLIPGLPGLSGSFITPDGDLDSVADREHVTGFYRGLPPTGAVVIPVVAGNNGFLLGVYR